MEHPKREKMRERKMTPLKSKVTTKYPLSVLPLQDQIAPSSAQPFLSSNPYTSRLRWAQRQFVALLKIDIKCGKGLIFQLVGRHLSVGTAQQNASLRLERPKYSEHIKFIQWD